MIDTVYGWGFNLEERGIRTAERFQNTSRLVALLVEFGRPESFGADLVGDFVDGGAEFLEQAPGLIETCFAADFRFVP